MIPGYSRPSEKRKVILTCAVSGNAPVNPRYPYQYPITPAQIADTVAEAAAAGATVAHIHVRDPETAMAAGIRSCSERRWTASASAARIS